jgi:hypothetical protein
MKRPSCDLFILFAAVAVILIHEYFKEGYFFKLSDVLKFPTHESIIILIIIIYLFIKIMAELRKLRLRKP